MEKEFIPYEQALALKELGFNEPCFGFYIGDIIRLTLYTDCGWKNSTIPYDTQEEILTTPLYQQAFKWFREKYNYNASIYPLTGKFSSQVYDIFRGCYITKIDLYETYEEAEIECLKKLIKIVKDAKK